MGVSSQVVPSRRRSGDSVDRSRSAHLASQVPFLGPALRSDLSHALDARRDDGFRILIGSAWELDVPRCRTEFPDAPSKTAWGAHDPRILDGKPRLLHAQRIVTHRPVWRRSCTCANEALRWGIATRRAVNCSVISARFMAVAATSSTRQVTSRSLPACGATRCTASTRR